MHFNKADKRLTYDLEEVLFIDTERKSLPFRQAASTKVKTALTWPDFLKAMNDGCGVNDLSKHPKRAAYYNPIKLVAIDSFTRMLFLLSENLKSQGVKGYDFWREYGEAIEKLLMTWQSKGQFIVFTAIDEVVRDADNIDRKVVKVQGKQLEGLIESFFSVVLFTHFNPVKQSPECYQFMTNTDGRSSAKSPVGMFQQRYIQNDMSFVLGSIYDYYKMDENPEFKPSPILICGRSGSGKSTSFKYVLPEN